MGYKRVSKLEQLIRLEVRMVRLTRLNDQITYMSAMRSSRVGIPSRWAEVDRILSSIVPEGKLLYSKLCLPKCHKKLKNYGFHLSEV